MYSTYVYAYKNSCGEQVQLLKEQESILIHTEVIFTIRKLEIIDLLKQRFMN